MSKLMNVSSSPHVRSKLTTRHVMCDVILALLPATVMGVYHFGISALVTILTSIAAAVLTEFYLIRQPEERIRSRTAVPLSQDFSWRSAFRTAFPFTYRFSEAYLRFCLPNAASAVWAIIL